MGTVCCVWRTLADADGFGLLEPDDAVRLRDAGYRRALLLEGFFRADELPDRHGYSPSWCITASIADTAERFVRRQKTDVSSSPTPVRTGGTRGRCGQCARRGWRLALCGNITCNAFFRRRRGGRHRRANASSNVAAPAPRALATRRLCCVFEAQRRLGPSRSDALWRQPAAAARLIWV